MVFVMEMISSNQQTQRVDANDVPFVLEILSQRMVQLSAQVQKMSDAAAKTDARLTRIENMLGVDGSQPEAGFASTRNRPVGSPGFDDLAGLRGMSPATHASAGRLEPAAEIEGVVKGLGSVGEQSQAGGVQLTQLVDRFIRAYLKSDAARAELISRYGADLEDQKKQLNEIREAVARSKSADSQTSLEARVAELSHDSEWMQEKLKGQDLQLQQVVDSTESWLSMVTQVASSAAREVTHQAERVDQFAAALEIAIGGLPALRSLVPGAASQQINQKAAVAP
jgi:hypothetical protein